MWRAPEDNDRLSWRERPRRAPFMYQSWRELLFLHWDFPIEYIQATLPNGLYVDSFDGLAWVGIVPFRMRDIRPWWLPSIPGVSRFLELNLRTYVHDGNGKAGVWFYSLDANQALAIWAARRFFHLNYQPARMESHRDPATGWIDYSSQRPGTPDELACRFRYRPTGPTRSAETGSFEFFLVERYVLFSQSSRGKLYSGQVYHPPYQIGDVELAEWTDALLPLNGLTRAGKRPVHAVACPGVDVDIFSLQAHHDRDDDLGKNK